MDPQRDSDSLGFAMRKVDKHADSMALPNTDAALNQEVQKNKKTYGRTPDGVIFTVPRTHDMVSQLLSPSQPKNLSDLLVLAILGLHFIGCYALPKPLRTSTFAVIFIFWRACYNLGIGCLLHVQSKHRRLVAWAKRSKVFIDPQTGKNPYPTLYKLMKRELETKIPEDYQFDEAPAEYNTWLIFRRVVDLILTCDFISYCLFAVSCASRPVGESMAGTAARWIIGWLLVGFNLWVKLDAHRVVKDYAWYWGDFFFLIDQELTFDGVFEMAPHPMYSVGYAGYYGISLMVASYNVLFVSIAAHLAQFLFLVYVENPHIEKTYNSPPPRRQKADFEVDPDDTQRPPAVHVNDAPPLASTSQPSSVHNLIGLHNIDFHRVTDTSVILMQVYIAVLAVTTPSTPMYKTLFVLHAVAWRLWYSVGIGYILNRQSDEMAWTRHFLKYGETTEEAWRQWKGIYHISMTTCYVSFIAASWKMYSMPLGWVGLVLLKHVLGVGLIILQVWTMISIYDSLGEFRWFFGDFFYVQAPQKLTYGGIYRFLNNPERVIGLAGVWGAALITRSSAIYFLALLSHVFTFLFLQYVERPHMQKLYGQSLRKDSGLVKSLKRSLPPHFSQWHGNVDKVLAETLDFVDDFVDAARPKIAAGVVTFMRDSTAVFPHPARLSITRLAPDLAGYDPKDYSLKLQGTRSDKDGILDVVTWKDNESSRSEHEADSKTVFLEYSAPIRVKWTAPLNHSKKDWVGLYKVADNHSREATRIASKGRWIATNQDQYDSGTSDIGLLSSDVRVSGAARRDGESKDWFSGEMEFSGDKLWWTNGVFEFRYHHNGKHNVMAISVPFEIKIERFDEEDAEVDSNGLIREAIEAKLLPLVRNCFDRNPEIAPNTVDEVFGALATRDGKFAKRIVFAISQIFGIEFASEVVLADGNIKNLAWRICNARKVLQPYSMTSSKGRNTPVQ